MALKEAVPSFGNPFLRFYSPSIDSPLIPDWNDLNLSSFGGRSPKTRWEEELQQSLQNKTRKEVALPLSSSTTDLCSQLQEQILNEALQQMEEQEEQILNEALQNMAKEERHVDDVITMDFPLDKYESSPYAEQILAYLNPFFKGLKEDGLLSKTTKPRENLEQIIKRFKQYSIVNSKQTQELKELMNVKKLLVPYLELDLPSTLIMKYNELEEDDPAVTMYQFNPVIGDKIRELGVLLDRYDTTKEVLCILVWSLHDNSLVCLPSVGLVPYPLCWTCHKSFGMQACSKCGVAKYCCKECQQSDWKIVHKTLCLEMSAFAEKHNLLTIE